MYAKLDPGLQCIYAHMPLRTAKGWVWRGLVEAGAPRGSQLHASARKLFLELFLNFLPLPLFPRRVVVIQQTSKQVVPTNSPLHLLLFHGMFPSAGSIAISGFMGTLSAFQMRVNYGEGYWRKLAISLSPGGFWL